MCTVRHPITCWLGAFFLISTHLGIAAGDPLRGGKAFQQCAACHSTKPGEHLTGPSLAHTWGQKAGTAKGFLRYSEPLQKSGVTWNEKTLDQWIAAPLRSMA